MTRESANVEIALRYLRAIEDGVEFDDLASFFAPDVVQVEYPNQLVRNGAERGLPELREAAHRGRGAVRPQRYEVRNTVASGEWVALEVTWAAVSNVVIGSVLVGGQLRANFGVFLQFRTGLIVRQHNYDCFDPF